VVTSVHLGVRAVLLREVRYHVVMGQSIPMPDVTQHAVIQVQDSALVCPLDVLLSPLAANAILMLAKLISRTDLKNLRKPTAKDLHHTIIARTRIQTVRRYARRLALPAFLQQLPFIGESRGHKDGAMSYRLI